MATLNSFRFLMFAFLIFTATGCSSDFDDKLQANSQETPTGEIINKQDALFHLINQVTTESDNALEEIVCIDFVYPVSLQIYDSQFRVVGLKIVNNDLDFSTFLGQLPEENTLSISYPIVTQLADNTTFSVNNNTELKLAIESCSREDIIAYCTALFGGNGQNRCVWKIPYDANADNKYTGGVFETNGDGTLKFTFKNTTYNGTWNFLFVNDEFHMNINLEGASEVATDWNIDRTVIYTGSEIIIQHGIKNYIMRQFCETALTYHVGDAGPAGGIVFYDKGFYSLGWRYMEVSATDTGFFEWGCQNSDILESGSADIGNGLYNSAAIVNFHDNLANYYLNPSVCNVLNNGTVAAQKALLEDAAHYDDWFLPTLGELQLVYTNIHLAGLGSFADMLYWTATQTDATQAKTINFTTGETVSTSKIPASNIVNTRAVRYF